MKHAIPMMLGAALLAASPACAEDNSFAGPYLGVEAGYEAYPDDFNGAMVGGIAGYNWAAGDLLLGIEGRYAKPFANSTLVTENAQATTTAKVSLKHQFGGSLRIGYRLSDNVALFANAGAERFTVDAIRTVKPKPGCTPSPTAPCATTVTDFGFAETLFTAGASLEVGFGENWRGRLSYRYGDGDAYTRNTAAVALIYAF